MGRQLERNGFMARVDDMGLQLGSMEWVKGVGWWRWASSGPATMRQRVESWESWDRGEIKEIGKEKQIII